MTGVNVPLLRKMVEWVEEQEQRTEGREWHQPSIIGSAEFYSLDTEHFCDTVYCVAGMVALTHGWEQRDEEVVSVLEFAEQALGLVNGDHGLFLANNSAADIRRIAERIAGEPL